MGTYEYVFTALKGIQAGKEYYVAMCPLKLIPKIFLFSEDVLPPELRAQRVLNKTRIPEMTNYIVENNKEYIFSSITASIDSDIEFKKIISEGKSLNDVGYLHIPMDASFLINDGQHRRAAIGEALKLNPALGDETISVVFFVDKGLKKSQQMFADLNKHAIRPTRSLGILYDHRDSLSNLARKIVENVQVFKLLTEKEKSSISNRSTKLFTLSSIFQGTLSLLKKTKRTKTISIEEENLSIEFWNNVCKNMKDWKMAMEKSVSTFELRKDYIHAHALAMHAIGKFGADLIVKYGDKYPDELYKLNEIDWSRNNKALWEGRAMIGGKISKSNTSIILTTNLLKKKFNIDLSPSETEIEKTYLEKEL